MKTPDIHTTRAALPQIYAYTTPEIERHNGWVKIGYTEKDDVEDRIKEQCHTADVRWHTEWSGNAVYENSIQTFLDTDFHAYLQRLGVDREEGTEWFHISGEKSEIDFFHFRKNRGVLTGQPATRRYQLRDSQRAAVEQTCAYFGEHKEGDSYLWNAKPRFGKTLAVYDLCQRLRAQRVLVVTNRPAIADSWYDDYEKFVGTDNYLFVSEVDVLKNRKHCLSRAQYSEAIRTSKVKSVIEFVSLQDLKGSIHFGGHYEKLKELKELVWDLLVVDEAHEGVDTYKTDVAFDQIRRKHTLYLSGTPFKMLGDAKFHGNIFNWTYADERKAMKDWDEERGTNPYAIMPQLNMYTYRMSDIVRDKVERGIDLAENGVHEYAFDLNEFFRVKGGKFVYDEQVDRFLDALMTQERFPFSTQALRDELRHTFWLLDRVESAKKLAEKLRDTKRHPEYSHYEIIVAAGDGKVGEDEEKEQEKAINRVKEAIKSKDYTITLSVGQLTTGVTIPQWAGVMMLSNVKSASLYMQTAFRAQNPYLFKDKDGQYRRKQNAYIFDFAPDRTLLLYDQMATGLYADTAADGGDSNTHKQRVRELLNFFPVIGEDENGEMQKLDAEQVLSIPRKLRSEEVVKRGFMSNFLFQNIQNIFSCPDGVVEILNRIQAYKEQPRIDGSNMDGIEVDGDGNALPNGEKVVGLQTGTFGKKLFKKIEENFGNKVEETVKKINNDPNSAHNQLNTMLDSIINSLGNTMVEHATEESKANGHPLSKRNAAGLRIEAEKKVKEGAGHIVSSAQIEIKKVEKQAEEDCKGKTTQEQAQIKAEMRKKTQEIVESVQKEVSQQLPQITENCVQSTAEIVSLQEQDDKKQSAEDSVRDHLRGFARTIPSFLMAYGSDQTTLENFDIDIPDDVFLDVTSISKEEFRLLRDGGDTINPKTGKKEHFEGHLFDSVVFNDSVKEFMSLRRKLANYFDPNVKEDIFDYIPSQKTNQIFTPKKVVKEMVDMLEKENPGCFDDPNKTFADLYMKSGLFVAEIVKRLYQSKGLCQAYPNKQERLRHIFAHQVYGLAPTEIIYRIATNFILGFDDKLRQSGAGHHFRLRDSLPAAKAGTMQDLVDSEFKE